VPASLRADTHIALVGLGSQFNVFAPIRLPIALHCSLRARNRANIPSPADTAEGETERMEPAKLNGKKAEPVSTKSVRAPMKKTARGQKAEKLLCRYCGSDDLAPSFIKRRDRRCRKCFGKRYSSVAREKKAKSKK
jgi:hypothetical protein